MFFIKILYIMEKTNLSEIKSDIKYKRDSLHLAHEELKRQGDYYNKFIIFISLASTLFESTKMKMGWNEPGLELFPIILSSIVAAISALIKFKRFNEQQEVLVQSCTVLTSTLSKARNSTEVDEDLLREYHEALELLETSLYPDVRKRFLKASQKNLISIIANEDDYFDLIEKAKSGEDISAYRSDNGSNHSGQPNEHSEENIKRFQSDVGVKAGVTQDDNINTAENVEEPPVTVEQLDKEQNDISTEDEVPTTKDDAKDVSDPVNIVIETDGTANQ